MFLFIPPKAVFLSVQSQVLSPKPVKSELVNCVLIHHLQGLYAVYRKWKDNVLGHLLTGIVRSTHGLDGGICK